MRRVIERATQGSVLGGVVGKAIGTIATAGTAVVLAPSVGIGAVACAAAAIVINSTTGEAIGTIAGAGIGGLAGAAEEHQRRKVSR